MSPLRKTEPQIRERIVELLRDGWTPQRIADEGKLADGSGLGVSESTASRVAREQGIAAKPGRKPGKPGKPGAGRPRGSRKPDDRRAAVLALRGAGFGWAEIARQLHLNSAAHARYLGQIPDEKSPKSD